MKIKVQITVEYEGLDTPIIEDIGCLCRGDLLPETLGLTLEEGKELLAKMQERMVTHQTAEYVEQQRPCPECNRRRGGKGRRQIVWRSLFGKFRIDSPRLYTCSCQPQTQKSFSPLVELLPERTAPELRYLQSKWASLMSYGLTVDLLEDVLPIQTNTQTISINLHKVAEQLESELGDEQFSFVEGCPRDWEALPIPDGRLTVGIDGGYVHAREGENRKAGWFEVIAGKSVPDEGQSKRFAFVNDYDEKPKRRLYEMLESQGLQMNQAITFLSDGGETVRNLQLYLSPQAEHILDWFHITMRITTMKNTAKGLPPEEILKDVDDDSERVKWYLWHGNVFKALQLLDMLEADLEIFQESDSVAQKLWRTVKEFKGYIMANKPFIPNYDDRYRYGETISTAFVESTVNQVVSKRMVKKQQMRWTKRGAHLVLQVRTKTLDGELKNSFCRWFPNMAPSTETIPLAA